MHELFTKVLSKRDLSRAGDLFSVADSEIVDDLTEVLAKIEPIIVQPDYLKNNNDQSVVEICVTRVLSCIRETKTAERHCSALVALLQICLKHDLRPIEATSGDPPHAKISADIISSLFLNYDKREVMRIALPVAVKFFQKGNKELSRNLASYLSLAAIDYAFLLSPHVHSILDSIISGNFGLCRVLSQIYEASPGDITSNVAMLVSLLPRCDCQEKLALLQLFKSIAEKRPSVLESSISVLCDSLVDTSVVLAIMAVLLKLAENRCKLIINFFDKIKMAAKDNPSGISLAAQILATAGKVNKEKAQFALDFVLEYLPYADCTSQTTLLQEATKLCSTYPVLFTDKVLACVRQKNSLSQKQSPANVNNEGNKTSGGVTIVKLNSPTTTSVGSTVVHKSTVNRIITTGNVNSPSTVTGKTNSTQTYQCSTSTCPSGTYATHVVTINASSITTSAISPTPSHTVYTRRSKLGDSRSTGRLHPSANAHRSMTRLHVAGGSVGGLHKSMTRLSSSQQINQNGSSSNNNHSSGNITAQQSHTTTQSAVPLNNNFIITGQNKLATPSTKIISGGVTVTTSPPRQRPHSHYQSTSTGSTGVLTKLSIDPLNLSTGSIATQQNSISVHHALPASPVLKSIKKSVTTLPINMGNDFIRNHEVIVCGPLTRSENTSVTLINANNSVINQRMSTFEPYQIMRDPVQQFCEKNFSSIKNYMDQVSQHLPPPTRCGIEERRTKKIAKLHFACQIRGQHCLYSKTCFTMRTRNLKTWIHLMFLDFQVRNYVKEKCVLNTREPGISNLKNLWQILKCENRSFTELVTSQFPSCKDQEVLVNELRHSGFLDVFEVTKTSQGERNVNELEYQWGCFLCNHPDKAVGFLRSNNQPMIEGQLKEKKGKWRLFRRWRTRYFTLSGAHLSCKGSSGGESIDVNQIRSVKVSRGARNIPKAFEIFTGDQTLILKPKGGKNAEEWVQCLSIVLAHSQARNSSTTKTNSLPVRGLGNGRTNF